MKPEYLKSLEFENHLTCKKLIDCKTSALALLHVYLRDNPVYKIEDLIGDEKARDLFKVWERMNHFCSVRNEKIKLTKVLGVGERKKKVDELKGSEGVVSSVKDTKSTTAKDNESTAEKEQETV